YLTRPALDRAPPLYAAACMQWSGTPIMVASARKRHLGKLPWVGYSLFGTMNPTRDDAVTIAHGGASGKRLELHLRHPPAAIQAMEQARDDLMGMFERCGLSPRVRAWDVEPPGESKHFGGSCRMHASPRLGVVDGWGRMHAVRNVMIADSSVFTTGPEKNPVLTSM